MNSFSTTRAKRFRDLNGKVKSRWDLTEDNLKMLLFNSAILDLFHLQGALNYSRTAGNGSLALSALQVRGNYTPAERIKISAQSAPDLILPKFKAIGDVKSGTMREDHLWTVAGYALGYESATKEDINLGIIYMVDTANDCIRSSRSVIFWISDDIRKMFLDRRDRALAMFNPPSEPAVLTDQDQIKHFCRRCTFEGVCHPRDAHAKNS